MYKEPHLQQKSNECAAMWREWFELFEKKDPVSQGLDDGEYQDLIVCAFLKR